MARSIPLDLSVMDSVSLELPGVPLEMFFRPLVSVNIYQHLFFTSLVPLVTVHFGL